MNKREKDLLLRVWDLSSKVPFPASGSNTTTVAGLSSYAEDMRQFQPALSKAIYACLCDSIPHLTEGEDYEKPEYIIGALEAWIEQRKRDQWNCHPPDFPRFYEEYKEKQTEGGTQGE